MLIQILLGIKDWILEGHLVSSAISNASANVMKKGPQLGYSKRPKWILRENHPSPIPNIKQWRSVPAKVELHEARRAGDHLDFRINIDDTIYDFAVVKATSLPQKTGKIQRVQRTPNHSKEYFYTDKAVFPPGSYGEGVMNTVWRGNIDIIESNRNKVEFYIPEGPFKGRYHIRQLEKGMIIGRMKEPELVWKERMKFSSNPAKLEHAYITSETIKNPLTNKVARLLKSGHNQRYIAEHKIDGANYMLIPGPKENLLISRRLSVTGQPINKADNIPQLKYHKFPEEFHGKCIHVEVVAREGSSSYTAGLLNAHPNASLHNQSASGKALMVYVWDIDIPGESYRQRLHTMASLSRKSPRLDRRPLGEIKDRFLFRRLTNPRLIQLPTSNWDTGETPREFAERLKAEGYEGVVIKDVEALYYADEFLKDKKVETQDFIIVDFFEGKGRNSGRLGGFIVEDPVTKVTSRVGGGFSDYQREVFWNHQEELKGERAQVAFHETTHNGVTRAPRFEGIHPESGILLVDEQGLLDYSAGAGVSPYAVKNRPRN